MTRYLVAVFVFVLLASLSLVGADVPVVVRPNETAYSAAEVATLSEAITALEDFLSTSPLASRRTFDANKWQSGDFAAYTAGILDGAGYETALVSSSGWEDSVHAWILVGIPVGATTAWIPVEASPEAGQSQQMLGHIPSSTGTSGIAWFEELYIVFDTVVTLPPNLPPYARVHVAEPVSKVDDRVEFEAMGSHDPDGGIVLYSWEFGDGQREVGTDPRVKHEYSRVRLYAATLTVFDTRGASTSTSTSVRIAELDEQDKAPAPGCACGG